MMLMMKNILSWWCIDDMVLVEDQGMSRGMRFYWPQFRCCVRIHKAQFSLKKLITTQFNLSVETIVVQNTLLGGKIYSNIEV